MPAGYSGTPLAKKLGIAAGATVALLAEPDGFCAIDDVWSGLRVVRRKECR